MIYTKSGDEIEKMRYSGSANAEIHAEVGAAIRPGITTRELERVATARMEKLGVRSSFRQTMGFPGEICVSVNEEVGHGIPGERVIQDGDLVKVDIGVEYQGFHTDAATTHIVGRVGLRTRYMVDVTERALQRALDILKAGRRISDVSHMVSKTVEDAGFRIVRRAFGHGVGSQLHEEPQIASFGLANHGARLKHGMTLAIEPVVVQRDRAVTKGADGWTDTTVDKAPSAHFEHTVLVTHQGSEILTRLEGASAIPRTNGTTPYVRLRHPSAQDGQPLFELAASQMDPILIEAWGRRANSNEIFDQPDTITRVIETDGGQIVGFIVYSRKTHAVYINTMIVDPRFHGTGVAADVMEFLKDEAVAHRRPYLELCVQTNNRRAIRFYEKIGFQHVQDTFVNTRLMRKKLP